MNRVVVVIGAGQLGSRHTQALKRVQEPLRILVVDPSAESLALTKQRYDEAPASGEVHRIEFHSDINSIAKTEVALAIIATASSVRFSALQAMLSNHIVKALVLEKVLFDEPDQYDTAINLVQQAGAKAWVNCCMRQIPVYQCAQRAMTGKGRINFHVSASRFGLLTNLIHYVDHMVHILGNKNFVVDASRLDLHLFPSKRRGFQEATGSLDVAFEDGSVGRFVNYKEGDAPFLVEIGAGQDRYIVRETEGKAWHSGASTGWQWNEIDGLITPQSILTTELAQSIFASGSCLLTPLADSTEIHLKLYEPIRKHFKLNKYIWT